jgi:hypothetical protein
MAGRAKQNGLRVEDDGAANPRCRQLRYLKRYER